MYINNIEDTCSMDELSGVHIGDLVSFEAFIASLRKCYSVYRQHPVNKFTDCFDDVKVLLYNCDNRDLEKYFKELGFKKVLSYKGNNLNFKGKPATINTWLLKVTPKIRRAMTKLQEETVGQNATSKWDN
jgi:hypothetical protein